MNVQLGKDIRIDDGDIVWSNNQDFAIVSDESNLWQAIYNRLFTNKGEYSVTAYGSELYKVYGEKRNDFLLSRVKGFIVECLKQEPRIKNINTIEVTYNSINSYQVDINIIVTPINSVTPLNLVFDYFLQ